MQKFGILNHGSFKDTPPRSVYMQSVFPACPFYIVAQTSNEFRPEFHHSGTGFFCFRSVECRGEYLGNDQEVFKKIHGPHSTLA